MNTYLKSITGVLLLLFLAGACTSELTFYVTRPAELPVDGIDNIALGRFQDITGENITLPGRFDGRQIPSNTRLKPGVRQFMANKKAAEFIKAMLTAGLSTSGQYRLVDTDTDQSEGSTITPDRVKTAVITANVKYYEFNAEDAEMVFYLLLATKGGLNIRDQAILLASRQGVIAAAERGRKGFRVKTPYIEKVAALEVAFDMTRLSNGERIVDTQRYRAYFARKWGGNPDTSHLPLDLKDMMVVRYGKNESLGQLIRSSAADLELALMDPDEYLARGGKLQTNRSVVENPLQIQAELAQQVVNKYLRQISRHTEKTTLEIASGDDIAVNYIRGNAYELAINRLENMDREEEDAYNLGLAYESIAESNQAAKYYQEALDKSPKNKNYRAALNRVRRNRTR